MFLRRFLNGIGILDDEIVSVTSESEHFIREEGN